MLTSLGRSLSAFSMLIIASVCSACVTGALRERPRVGSANVKIVAVVWPSVYTTPLTPDAWRASPWYRYEDTVTPARVVIATDRSACIMPDGVDEPRATEAYECVSGWRYAKNRGR